MRFIIDSDTGDSIVGWLTPDNPNEKARILVCFPGTTPVEIEATISRPDVVALSLHATGVCGFRIDETQFPNLRRELQIELRDAVSNILLYRRFDSARHIARRLVFLDASVLIARNVQNIAKKLFTHDYTNVESMTYETLYSMIYCHQGNSIFMAGRPHFMRQVTGFKERNYLIAALLHDPFEELAARLLFFNLLAKTKNPAPLMGFATGLLPLTEFARTLDFESEKSLTRAFRAASPETRALIRDPQTRMIACEPEERATRHHVTKALDLLSSMDVVGTRGRFSDFKAILADVLGADIIGDATMEPSPIVSKLADRLSRMSLVHNLLEQDLALYSYAEEAFELGFAAAAARA